MIISVDGKIVDSKKACLLVTSKAFLFGFSVFETMRTYNKKIFRLEDHLKRLYESVKVLNLKSKWDFKKVHKITSEAVKKSKYKESRIRVILASGQLIIMIEELKEKPSNFYKKGIKLVSYKGSRSIPYAKVLGDVFCYTANQYAQKNKAYDSILVDSHNSIVRECSYANIFWVKSRKLFTTDKNILYGITRDTVVEISDGCNFKDIKLQSLLKADEVFITQTSSGILPVVMIDGQKIGDGKVGGVAKRLLNKFNEVVCLSS